MMHSSLPAIAAPQIYFYTTAVDMRRSFDGLTAIVQSQFDRDVRKGDLFVFLNKRGDRLKALWWDSDGLAIFMKRLEVGTYQRPVTNNHIINDKNDCHRIIDRVQLGLLLSGIDFTSVQRRKRYQPPVIQAPHSTGST